MRSCYIDGAGSIRIGVNVDSSFSLQLFDVLFGPLGGADQAELFAVPKGENNGPLRLPALAAQHGQRAGGLHQCRSAAGRIACAVHPGVVMIAVENPLVLKHRAGHGGDDIVERLVGPVEIQLEMYGGGAGTDVIGEGQRSAPFFGSDQAAQLFEQRPRVAPGNREHWNLDQVLRVGRAEGAWLRVRRPNRASDGSPG